MIPRRIILIGNYLRDRQESMQRYAAMLRRDLETQHLMVEILQPPCVFGSLAKDTLSGFGKWLGYLDKYILFPLLLTYKQLRSNWPSNSTVIHIADHSNAVYAPFIWKIPCVATCHDVLAIRGALGDKEAFCPATRFGQLLQKVILRSLTHVSHVGCDSYATQTDFERLTSRQGDTRVRTIRIGMNSPFIALSLTEADSILANADITLPGPFLIHVGSSLPRKNRQAVLRTLSQLRPAWDGYAVFAGSGLSEPLKKLAIDLDIQDRVIEVIGPTHLVLNALYAKAHALVFPSYSEGFGWPILEAQASGCPVICSDRTSLPEVAGDGALVTGADDVEGMVRFVRSLTDEDARQSLIERGNQNLVRFSNQSMTDSYLTLYADALSDFGRLTLHATQNC